MNLSSLVTDNITELLVKIIEFTQTRQKLLSRNINNADNPSFIPKDLAVQEFTELLNDAIDEHIRNRRLVLRDTENITFGFNGTFQLKPVVDKRAKHLIEQNRDAYIRLQINKALENSLNQRVAAELLRQKQGMVSVFE